MITTDDDFDDDPHPAWARKVAAIREASATPGLDEEEVAPLTDRLCDLRERIANTPARTLAGMREQIMLTVRLQREGHSHPGPVEEKALENALATLDKLLAIERRRERQRQRHAPDHGLILHGLPPGSEA